MELLHAELSERLIGAAIEVHRNLGPGLLESAYEAALARELELRQVSYQRQVALPVVYKGVPLDCGYRIDFVVDARIVVELKAIERFEAIHEAQLLTYLRLSGLQLGFLINFNTLLLKDGIRRRVLQQSRS